VNVDLRRFVPSWAAQGLKVPEDSSSHGAWQGLADAIKANPGAETEEVGLLAWNQWSAAIALYGIAAMACGQWSLAALFAHKQVVLQVLAARPRTGLFLGFCFECSQVAVAAPPPGAVGHSCSVLRQGAPHLLLTRSFTSNPRAGGSRTVVRAPGGRHAIRAREGCHGHRPRDLAPRRTGFRQV